MWKGQVYNENIEAIAGDLILCLGMIQAIEGG